MLTEDDVIDAVRDHLVAQGWEVVTRARATQRGEDLVVARHGQRLSIEAKGEGSSKEGTARYGKTFSNAQVRSHVARAVQRSGALAADPEDGTQSAGAALPDTPAHQQHVQRVRVALDRLGVKVFWVAAGGGVSLG